jgi:maltokinase
MLHVALATASTVFPEPIKPISDPGWALAGHGVLNEASELARQAGDDDGRWLLAHAERLAAEIGSSARAMSANAIHPHGDLHVGQVLKWRNGLAVTDFDGNPTLTGPTLEPAARDIAQLRTSLLHVGEIANRRTDGRFRRIINEWSARSADELLYAYQRILKANGLSEIFDPRLLRAFEVEQECRELLYAARFLPRWRYAPMGVLRSWFTAEGES